jgi:hypothetical protein
LGLGLNFTAWNSNRVLVTKFFLFKISKRPFFDFKKKLFFLNNGKKKKKIIIIKLFLNSDLFWEKWRMVKIKGNDTYTSPS